MITVMLIDKDLVPIIWPEMEPFMELAAEKSNGELTTDILLDRIMTDRMVIAGVYNDGSLVGGVTFEQMDFPSGKRVLHAATAGGEGLIECMHQVNALGEALAIKYKCEEIYIIGRPGWVKALKKIGFAPVHTIISRKVGV